MFLVVEEFGLSKSRKSTNSSPVRVIAVHPLNDYSGSPRVLADFLTCRLLHPDMVTIITGRTSGFLHDGLGQRCLLWYPGSQVKVLKLLSFVLLQVQLFFATVYTVLRSYLKGEKVVVINNTMLSMGSILATRLCFATNIVYLHEWTIGSQRVGRIVRFLSNVLIRVMVDEVIFVSKFLSDRFEFRNKLKTTILPNGLRADFDSKPKLDHRAKFNNGKVLFVGYLKKNKGILELLKIAEKMPAVSFQAVLNCSADEINDFVARYGSPKNLELLPQKVDVQVYYQEAFLVMNLSLADVCLESFSLSILEGMSCGSPAVVPPAGGHFEYFDSSAGEAIDARSTDQIVAFIAQLKSDFSLWKQYSDRSVELVDDYSAAAFQKRVERFLSRYLR